MFAKAFSLLTNVRPRRPGSPPRRLRRRCELERLEDRTLLDCGCGAVTDLTVGHVDGFAIDYFGGAWHPGTWDRDNDVRYTTDQVRLVALPAARTAQPAGAQWSFLGAGAGNDVWVLPQIQNPGLLYLGSNSERTPFGAFASYFESDPRVGETAPWIKVTLKDVRGPGNFSVWQTNSFGTPVAWMSTADGIGDSDALYLLPGSHLHFNWGFTARGIYEVDVEASAYLGPGQTNPTSSGTITYCFSAERPGCLVFSDPTYNVSEAGTTATITVNRVNGSDGRVTVDYATADGSAVAGSDYTATSGTLTFEDGETSKTFTVPVIDNAAVQPDRTVNLTLSSPTNGARLGEQYAAVLTIQDDDVAQVSDVVVNDGSVQRSQVGTLTVTFSDVVALDDGAFEVTDQNGEAVAVTVSSSAADGRTVAVLTLWGTDVGQWLADGGYTLTVVASRVHDALGRDLDGDGDGAVGGDRADAFFRLFGDTDGDGHVDANDEALFLTSLGRSAGDEGYLWYFDYNGDGTVDEETDYAAFQLRLGT